MLVKSMGRRREHDEQTAAALLDAAERIVAANGASAVSLRDVAREAGTTTRAVYSLFGGKDGLLGALGVRAFDLLQRDLEALPETRRPANDVVEASLIFRRFVLEHPALFSIAFHDADPSIWPRFRDAAADALTVLHRRFERLDEVDKLGGRSVSEAATQFHALCEGMAWSELRGNIRSTDPERFWRSAFRALVEGFATPAASAARARGARPGGSSR